MATKDVVPPDGAKQDQAGKATHFVRFSFLRRVEHLIMIVVFLALAVTGFPQKFYDSGWARSVVLALGGVESVRIMHRIAGIVFALLVGLHLAIAGWSVVRRTARLSVMIPGRQDFLDAIHMLKYYLGASKTQPRFDRFDYRQKFEYWGLVFGSLLMVVTGFVLLYPMAVASWLAGQIIPVAKMAHSSEGLMAFLVIIVWHIYNAHLSPDVFPFDKTIFTGKISRKRMQHEHPLELERLEAASSPLVEVPPETKEPPREAGG